MKILKILGRAVRAKRQAAPRRPLELNPQGLVSRPPKASRPPKVNMNGEKDISNIVLGTHAFLGGGLALACILGMGGAFNSNNNKQPENNYQFSPEELNVQIEKLKGDTEDIKSQCDSAVSAYPKVSIEDIKYSEKEFD